MKTTKKIGMILLGVYLIMDGLIGFGIGFGPWIFLLYLLGIIGGVFVVLAAFAEK